MIYIVETKTDKPKSIVAESFLFDKEINGVIFEDWKGENVAFYSADDIKSITKA